MDIKVTEIKPGEISIDSKLLAKLMGFDEENIPEPYGEIIQRELDETVNYSNIKGGFRISDNVDIVSPKGVFLYENVKFSNKVSLIRHTKTSIRDTLIHSFKI